MWINDERRLRCDQQRVAVGIGLRHRLGANACAGTCLVLDNYRLRPRGAEPLSHCACDGVGRAAGWVRNDYAHCLRREGLRPAEVWKDCHAKHGCGEPKMSASNECHGKQHPYVRVMDVMSINSEIRLQ